MSSSNTAAVLVDIVSFVRRRLHLSVPLAIGKLGRLRLLMRLNIVHYGFGSLKVG